MIYERLWIDNPQYDANADTRAYGYAIQAQLARVSASEMLQRANAGLIRNRFIWIKANSNLIDFEYGVGCESWDGQQTNHVRTGVAEASALFHMVEEDTLVLKTHNLQKFFKNLQSVIIGSQRKGKYYHSNRDLLTGEVHNPYIFIGPDFLRMLERIQKRCAEKIAARKQADAERSQRLCEARTVVENIPDAYRCHFVYPYFHELFEVNNKTVTLEAYNARRELARSMRGMYLDQAYKKPGKSEE